MYTIASIMLSYVMGSIPIGYIIARLYGVRDIRLYGSGNIGATNVARALGIKFFILVFTLDAAKAYVTIEFLRYKSYSESILLAAALAHLIGNGYSLFLCGRGGKGVATSIGLLCALQPLIVPFIIGVWVITFLSTRTVGIASVVGIACVPLSAWIYGYSTEYILFSLCLSGWVLIRHRTNIKAVLER